MRRKFILLLLGIICFSTLSSLLSGFVRVETNKVLVDTVLGTVGAGNFSYWQLSHSGPLLVELLSLSGDADLYISDNSRPSYETDQNNLSSTTCGIDLIAVPPDFPRPIGIGVFGHWSHSISDYTIRVYLDTSKVFTEEQFMDLKRSFYQESMYSDSDKRSPEVQHSKETATDKTKVIKLLSILDIIFDMFIL